MTIQEANKYLGKEITVKHKISGELYTVTLTKRYNGVVYETSDGTYFIVTPVEFVHPVNWRSFNP